MNRVRDPGPAFLWLQAGGGERQSQLRAARHWLKQGTGLEGSEARFLRDSVAWSLTKRMSKEIAE